jgi:hypothetical protein
MFIISGKFDERSATIIRDEFVKWLEENAKMETKLRDSEPLQKQKRFYDGRASAFRSAAEYWKGIQFVVNKQE